MATGSTANYSFPYPLSTDPVNVSGDIEALANKIDSDLAEIVEDTAAAQWSGGSFTNGLLAPTYNESTAKFSMSMSQNLSASGSPSFVDLSLSGSVTSGTWNANTIAASKGGTGQSSYTVGDILYASASATLDKLSDVATGNSLISGGVGVAPFWGKIGLTTHVSGVLDITNGGTGLSANPSNGQLLIGNGSGFTLNTLIAGQNITITNASGSVTIDAIADAFPSQTGNAGKFITTNGTLPSWQFVAISDVTDLNTELNSKLNLSGGTLTGKTTFVASSASASSIRIPSGTAPTSASHGDMWTTSEGLFIYVDDEALGPIGAGNAGIQDVLMFAGM